MVVRQEGREVLTIGYVRTLRLGDGLRGCCAPIDAPTLTGKICFVAHGSVSATRTPLRRCAAEGRDCRHTTKYTRRRGSCRSVKCSSGKGARVRAGAARCGPHAVVWCQLPAVVHVRCVKLRPAVVQLDDALDVGTVGGEQPISAACSLSGSARRRRARGAGGIPRRHARA